MNQITIPTTVRRSFAILSLCLLVAMATAAGLSAGNASAAPVLAQLQAPRPAPAAGPAGPAGIVRAESPSQAPASDDDEGETRSRGKVLRGKLNLNTATGEQLQLLPGVGPAKSERIVEYRQKHGKFRRIQDLRRVKGFGQKTLKKLTPYLAVDGENTLAESAE
jgi:competence protein ComEA